MLTRYFASAFVALAPLALFAQLSEVEPNDGFPQANALPPNTTMTGTVGCLTLDDDRFYLVVPTDGVLTITAQVSSTFSTDLQLNVYRGDGSGFPLSYHTAASSSGGAITTTMIRNCTAGSDYHFLLGQSATDCFSYVISWTVAAPLFGNDTEPNDGFPIVTLTPPNTDTDGHTNFLDYGTNDDRFRIDAADDGILTINWSAENAGAADATGALIQLYRGDGSGFAVETDSVPVGGGGTASTAQLTWTCRGASDYHLRFSSTGLCGVSYRFSYTLTPAVYGNDPEPNDGFPIGALTPPNTDTDGHTNFLTYGTNDDRFRINAAEDGILNIIFAAENAGAADPSGAEVNIYDGSGTGFALQTWDLAVGGNSTPTTSTVSLPCRGNSDYYLRISANAVCGVSYRFNYSITPAVFGADPEPNNNTADAIPLSTASIDYEGRLNFYGEDNDDRFIMTVPTGASIVFDITAENAGTEDSLTCYISLGGGAPLAGYYPTVGGNSTPVTTTLSFTPAVAGGYVIRFVANSCGVSYELNCNDADGDGICNGTVVGLDDLTLDGRSIRVQPNPSSDGLYTISASGLLPVRLLLSDLSGRTLRDEGISATSGSLLLDAADLPQGSYVLRLMDASSRWAQIKLVRTH